jgi:nucleoside-triphosphatase THEP1
MIVIITAPPGTGKSTIFKKLLREPAFRIKNTSGFITEEILQRNDLQKLERVGFKMELINPPSITSNQAVMDDDYKYRIIAHKALKKGKFLVGKYSVYPENINALLKDTQIRSNMLIDEVDRMQHYSSDFREFVKKVIKESKFCVISVTEDIDIALANRLKEDKENLLIEVTKSNRDWVPKLISNLKPSSYQYDDLSPEKRIALNEEVGRMIRGNIYSMREILWTVKHHLFTR